MKTEEILRHFGLLFHPFDKKWTEELSPKDKKLLPLYAKVEGFGQCVDHIHEWFEENQDLDEPVFILVYGPKGSGRSSVINYMTYHVFREYAATDNEIVQITARAKDNHPTQPIQDVLGRLFKYVKRQLNIDLKKDYQDLERYYQDYVLDANEPANKLRYNDILFETMPLLKANDETLIVVFDNIVEYAQIDASIETFEDNCPITFFTTSEKKVLDNFASQDIHGFSIILSEFTLQDVLDFIDQRWQAACDHQKIQHPFDEEDIRKAFDDPNLTFKAVVKRLRAIFNGHLLQIKIPINTDLGDPVFPPISTKTVLAEVANTYISRKKENLW